MNNYKFSVSCNQTTKRSQPKLANPCLNKYIKMSQNYLYHLIIIIIIIIIIITKNHINTEENYENYIYSKQSKIYKIDQKFEIN